MAAKYAVIASDAKQSLTAHAIVTAIGEGKQFATARDLAAWCALTRRVDQSANTRRQRGISRSGDSYRRPARAAAPTR